MVFASQTVQFNADLLNKYNQPLPRYTSYPPATELKESFGEVGFRQAIAASNQRRSPLSLYFHIPFCQSACYFCGCNVIVTGSKSLAETYLDYLERDIHQTAAFIDESRPVQQLHWGGGTPNYLTIDQAERLWTAINRHFNLAADAEVSIEINPRYVDRNYIRSLRQIGFNRISFGIQDFNRRVQEAVNRVQPEELLFDVMDAIRESQFDSVNVDLIYGLPYQTLDTFSETIRKTVELNPDRIAVFNFAYVPWLKPVQKHIPMEALPAGEAKLDILRMTIEELGREEYLFIGMDHFAKPNDELAIAQRNGTLKRNFQGYTTQPDTDLFAFGMTSISMLHDAYVQNHKRLKSYYRAIDQHDLPIERGVGLHPDDILRRTVIMELMCQFRLSKAAIASAFDIDFDRYFQTEQWNLKILEQDGLVKLTSDSIEVTPTGRLLIRNVASVFDEYLRDRIIANFSKAIG